MELGSIDRFLLALVFFLCVGCANTALHSDILKDQGTIRYEEENSEIYKVFVKNTVDFNWSGDDSNDRLRTAKNILRNKCNNIKLLEENYIQTGTYAFNKPAKIWVMKIQCEK